MNKDKLIALARSTAFSLLVCLFMSNACRADDLHFSVTLEKKGYLVGEGMNAIFRLINNGTSPVIIRPFSMLTGDIRVDLREDKRGNLAMMPGMGSTHFLDTLFANDTITYVQCLDNWFAPTSLSCDCHELSSGTYTLKAKYVVSPEMSLESEEVSFVISEPVGPEEIAHKEFSTIQRRRLILRNDILQEYEAFASEHRYSAYRPRVMALLTYEYESRRGDRVKGSAIAESLLAQYPNSTKNLNALGYMIRGFTTSTEKIAFLQRLSRNYPNTFLESSAREWSRSITRKESHTIRQK